MSVGSEKLVGGETRLCAMRTQKILGRLRRGCLRKWVVMGSSTVVDDVRFESRRQRLPSASHSTKICLNGP